ncbi:dTDP-4-dehydrorhamnose reductase [Oikeobacillus pervagus]|uniref:dTDP-4-dehydrorhamnose reductase n=1 Tax=Oikeobacillus pervagus TaxID=1325931 RepID=A0AAJ1SXG8_9BACI|nr:dTDP-4-dehydrorhamnose reductase [Oikeobacillus pervagus]MDQ0214459.1 dTDP-4-dehydrorhamnose reductase [Oikeobacillus pervagus]
MDILITGANGQLGKELKRQLSHAHNVVSLDKEQLDVTNQVQVDEKITQINPQIIIHSAAFTNVDQCEIDRKKAFSVNSLGASHIAQAANKTHSRMFYISTDYVFDGRNKTPYPEEYPPNPQSVYGLSKWLGEQLVLGCKKVTIIRTSWLYGHDGENFVKTMLEMGKKNKEIRVVNDQIGSPTYVNDLTTTLIQLFGKKDGIYHVSNSGACTWYLFAKAIFNEAGFNPHLIYPVTTEEYGAIASRPHYSVLGHQALIRERVKIPRHWHHALKAFIRKEINS